MASVAAMALCLVLATVCSGLVLDRLPRHIPKHKAPTQETMEEDANTAPSFDKSVLKKKIIYVQPHPQRIYRFHKRSAAEDGKSPDTSESDQNELANILKDENQDEDPSKEFGSSRDEQKPARHNKTKRQSGGEAEKVDEDIDEVPTTSVEGDQEKDQHSRSPDFQKWLRQEYYRNMAKSFASMRRKRNGGSTHDWEDRDDVSRPKRAKKAVSFEEVTDNLRAIEDVLFLDALRTLEEGGGDYEGDALKQRRITNDLSSAYDLETMRNALFRLKETLGEMEQEQEQVRDEEIYRPLKRKVDQCPPLELLTSGCSTLGDIVSDAPMKKLLHHACNWHEVCYTCGEAFGLTSENCDVGFIEQSQTICRGDVPCESTASLLLLPLRQRRVFYKRSNPSVCLVDPCVEDFLKQV